MDLTERTVDSREVFRGRIIRVRQDTVRLPNGKESSREVVEHPGGVGILAIDGEDRVVLVRQYRYAIGREMWELPAGKLEPGEDPFAAAFRRMLTLEQYRTPEMGALYQQYLGAGPTAYTADLLQAMGEKEPQKQAIALYGSMFLLYALYDGAEEKQAIEQLARDCISARLKKEEAYA